MDLLVLLYWVLVIILLNVYNTCTIIALISFLLLVYNFFTKSFVINAKLVYYIYSFAMLAFNFYVYN